MLILDGKKVRDEIAKTLRKKIAALSSKPTLAIIQIGSRAESNAYIERKRLFGESIGATVLYVELSESVRESDIRSRIQAFNADESVHGVILQLPLPPHLDRQTLMDAIAPEKDVDGLTTAQTAARKAGNGSAITPATARGILELLEFYRIPIAGRKAAVLGRSALVGAPTAEALRKAGAEVAVCHSETPNTKEITRASDIVVVAIGKPRLIGREYFRGDKTQTVVDVGINPVKRSRSHGASGFASPLFEEIPKRTLVGDVDFDAVKDMVAAISPVPGGVGPMTVAALFENLMQAWYDTEQRMGANATKKY